MVKLLLAVTVPETFGIMRGFPAFLTGRGWCVVLTSSPGGLLDEFRKEGFQVAPVPMVRNPSPIEDFRSLIEWFRLLQVSRPDIVWAGTPKASLLGMLAAWGLRVPVRIYDVKGLRYETESGVRRQVLVALERLTCLAASHVLAISPSVASAMRRDRIAPASKIESVGAGGDNGVDFDRLEPANYGDQRRQLRETWGAEDGDVVVGFVGRLNKDKGIDHLVVALTRIAASGRKVICVLVGADDGFDLNQTGAAGVEFHRVGFVKDPLPYYAAFDVFCLPTLREGLPNVNIQAAAMGLPVVSTTATGAIDTVKNGQTGVLVPPGDAAALADALTRVIDDREKAIAMGRAGRDFVRENFQQADVWRKREEWLSRIVDTGPKLAGRNR